MLNIDQAKRRFEETTRNNAANKILFEAALDLQGIYEDFNNLEGKIAKAVDSASTEVEQIYSNDDWMVSRMHVLAAAFTSLGYQVSILPYNHSPRSYYVMTISGWSDYAE